ncbi:DDE_3 domain-containing protein [Trichonephila clavipes]|nr:DDE_3 domain-containing protein [Trichonephila clavipes]
MRGTLTGQRYVDDILRPHVGPFLNGLPGAIFQQDNARPHTARVAQDFLRHFQTLPWPARSPYLSPVEHVWDQPKTTDAIVSLCT